MGKKKLEATRTIRDRIRELRRVPARELLPNPRNWRRHPREQATALQRILAEVGYADALLARETPDGLLLIDGHLRAETTPEQDVPVLVLDVTEEEADKILLTLDPLAGLATVDEGNLRSLMDSVRFSSDELAASLQPLWPGRRPELRDLKDPPAQIDRAGELMTKWGTAPGQAWLPRAGRASGERSTFHSPPPEQSFPYSFCSCGWQPCLRNASRLSAHV
jgi:ParB-like nuclease family protein